MFDRNALPKIWLGRQGDLNHFYLAEGLEREELIAGPAAMAARSQLSPSHSPAKVRVAE